MRRAPGVLAVVSASLVATGAVTVATAPRQGFGWFAYAPLSGDVDQSPVLPLVLGGQQVAGLVAVVVGLVVAGLALGLRLGRRGHS